MVPLESIPALSSPDNKLTLLLFKCLFPSSMRIDSQFQKKIEQKNYLYSQVVQPDLAAVVIENHR
jgi:hypothetical protein